MTSKIYIFLTLLFTSFLVNSQQDTTAITQDTSGIQKLYNRIITLDDKIRNDPSLQVNNFTVSDTASLPIGIVKEIGNIIYIICIDSAKFTPQGAFFNVYMALDFPNSSKGKIAFAVKDVQFNPQGVIVSNGARLNLVSQQAISLGPKMEMIFKNNGNNFIEWDCNGYKQTGLSVDFVFNQEFFENAMNPSEPVKAGMDLVVQDLNDITFQLTEITPFRVKGADDFIFSLQNIVIDRSEFTTPPNVNLSSQTLQLYNGDKNSWKGFYAQNAIITLPEKLSRDGENTQIYAENLIIDDAGLSGSFGANNVFSTAESSMNGQWGFSVDNIQVDIENNHLTGGALSGTVEITAMDNNGFNYSASISESPLNDLEYHFLISPDSAITYNLNMFKSSVTLNPSSRIEVQSVNNKFIPTAIFSGTWNVNHQKASVSGIAFQDLTITTSAPFITSGAFALVGDNENNLINLPISINSVGINLTSQNQLAFSVGASLNLGRGNTNFGVATTFFLNTNNQINSQGRDEIVFNSFNVNDIAIDISTNPFNLIGVVSIRNNDPTFGDLFYGSISLDLKTVLEYPLLVSVGFGKKDGEKYWFTEASIPATIPICASLAITSIYGGVQSGVSSILSNEELLDRVAGDIPTPTSGNTIPFTPNPLMGLEFRAGVGLAAITSPTTVKEELFNGDALLTVAFNPNGGFASIDFLGKAYMMVNRQHREDQDVKKVWGDIAMSYDNNQKIFDTEINAAIIVPNALTGAVNVKFHIDQNDWYFWLNRPSNRAYLSLANIFNINAYFMIGTQVDPIPPPPSYVTNLVGAGSINSVNLSEVHNGNGFATGVSFASSINGEFPKQSDWRGYANFNVGGGFDLMLADLSNTRCAGSSAPIGINGYYCLGQVYAYLNGSLGVRKYKNGNLKKEYQLGTLQMAALLQGKLPKPTYMFGAVAVQASVLGIINFSFNAEVEFGNNCQFVGI